MLNKDNQEKVEDGSLENSQSEVLERNNDLEKKDLPQKVVALRPIWKVIIALLIGFICLCAIYNLVRTFNALKHPKVIDKQSLTSFATETDVSWYKVAVEAEKNQLGVKKEGVIKDEGEVSSQPTETSLSPKPIESSEEDRKAMSASISSNQITVDLSEDKSANELKGSSNQGNTQENLLGKSNEETSIVFKKKESPYTLQAGTIIPGILISGINSSLPGQVLAQVRTPVFDSTTGKNLLIPQGSKLVGNYESKICFGQKRLFLIWQRIILPSGDSIHLGGMPGNSLEGYSGFKDKVDNHYGALLKSALLMSILSTGAEALAGSTNESNHPMGSDRLGKGIGLPVAETASQLVSKSMEVEPTLTIRPGYLFNITATKDIVFSGPYSE